MTTKTMAEILASKSANPFPTPTAAPTTSVNQPPVPEVDKTLGIIEPTAATARPVEAEPELPSGPPGSYRALRLQRFFRKDGSTCEPVDGFFVPETEEEDNELKHFAKQWGMVEYQPFPEEAE